MGAGILLRSTTHYLGISTNENEQNRAAPADVAEQQQPRRRHGAGLQHGTAARASTVAPLSRRVVPHGPAACALTGSSAYSVAPPRGAALAKARAESREHARAAVGESTAEHACGRLCRRVPLQTQACEVMATPVDQLPSPACAAWTLQSRLYPPAAAARRIPLRPVIQRQSASIRRALVV